MSIGVFDHRRDGQPARNPSRVMMLDEASERLLTASAEMATLPGEQSCQEFAGGEQKVAADAHQTGQIAAPGPDLRVIYFGYPFTKCESRNSVMQ